MNVYMKWWIFGPLIGLLTLSQIRCELFENNLFDTYAEGEWPVVECGPDDLIYRSYARPFSPAVSAGLKGHVRGRDPRALLRTLVARESRWFPCAIFSDVFAEMAIYDAEVSCF